MSDGLEGRVEVRSARVWFIVGVLAVCSRAALAVPTLQLYSPDATYDPVSESWVTTSDPFELWVVGARTPDLIHTIDELQLHIALLGFDESWDPASLNPTMTISAIVSSGGFPDKNPLIPPAWSLELDEDDLDWGRPWVMDLFTGNLPWHGVYPAWYWTITLPAALDVDDSGETAYNFTGDYDPLNPSASGVDYFGDIQYYSISYGPYSSEVDLHLEIDLTGHAHNGWSRWRFAPFSHNAEAVYTPEPATLSLLAAGAALAALMARRRRRV